MKSVFALTSLALLLPVLAIAQGNAYQPQLLTGVGAPGTGALQTCTAYQYYIDTSTGNRWDCKPDASGAHGAWISSSNPSSLDGIIYVDGVTYPRTDVGITNAVAALPTVNGYKSGKIILSPGTYTLSSTVTINSPYVLLDGLEAAAVNLNCTVTNGDCFLIVDTPFTVNNGAGGFMGLTLTGNSGTNQTLIHTRDMTVGFRLWDVILTGCSGTGGTGWWAENFAKWTERTSLNGANFNHCTTDILATVNAGANASFNHQTWMDVRFNLNNGQTAIQLNNNIDFGRSLVSGVVNADGNGASTVFNLAGTSDVSNLTWLNLNVDNNGGGTVTGVSSVSGANFTATGYFTGWSTNSASGQLLVSPFQNAIPIIVGNLPSAASGKDNVIVVSDSTAIASEGQTCVGGSSNTALAFSNGSVWKCF